MQKIREVMTPDIVMARPEQTIADAARLMLESDIGSVPVSDGDRLIGMLTDRDIAIRATAKNLPCDTPVAEVMTREIRYCYDDQDVGEVARNMADLGVRRLPVVNRDKRIVGFVALSNIAQSNSESAREALLAGVATPH